MNSHELGRGENFLDLVQFSDVVERHARDVGLGSVANVRHLLARIRVNNAIFGHIKA